MSGLERPRPDLDRILFTIRRHGADVVLVGSTAAYVQRASRIPGDVDLVTADGWANAERLAAALRELHAGPHVDGLDPDEARLLSRSVDAATIAGAAISCWHTDGGDIDLLDSLVEGRPWTTVYYDDLAERSITRRFGGIRVAVASLDDLIGAAEATDRDHDRHALPELHALREAREQVVPARRPQQSRGHDLDR